jgi:peptidyl-dipeptidase A
MDPSEHKYLYLFAFLSFFLIVSSQDEELCEKNAKVAVQPTCPLSLESLTNLAYNFSQFINKTGCEYNNETCAWAWINQVNFVFGKAIERSAVVQWTYETNITDYNSKLVDDMTPLSETLAKAISISGEQFYNHSKNWNSTLRRMLYLSRVSLPINPIVTKMTEIYATSVVCTPNNSTCLPLDPDLTTLMANSRNNTELTWAWNGWFNNTGIKIRPLFIKYVAKENQIAREYGFKDMSEVWIDELETPNLENVCDDLLNQMKPLYQQLHAYVRRKLRLFYGDNIVKGPFIPAQLLGNLWDQDWSNIYDIVTPYPQQKSYNLTEILIRRNFTALRIFKLAEDFFLSIGLYPMTPQFWKYSMIVKPQDRKVLCHGSAWDFYNGRDFRIKMCTQPNEESFYTVHHEMGHIEYFMSYAHQPVVFRDGANSALHEAIGDTIALSVDSETHLKKIGLLSDFKSTNESNINFLMKMALSKIAFMPFGYLLDKYRWNVFRGNITDKDYNKKWWEFVNKYQGVDAPEKRNETYFDPGAKFHVAADVPYVRYFLADFLQFQFYQRMCQLSNHTGPLHTCDYSGSLEAGLKLKEMLSLGRSEEWKFALKQFTGEDNYSASSILEYFSPLMEWLKVENAKFPNEKIGWPND